MVTVPHVVTLMSMPKTPTLYQAARDGGSNDDGDHEHDNDRKAANSAASINACTIKDSARVRYNVCFITKTFLSSVACLTKLITGIKL